VTGSALPDRHSPLGETGTWTGGTGSALPDRHSPLGETGTWTGGTGWWIGSALPHCKSALIEN